MADVEGLADRAERDLTDRHPSTVHLLQFFTYDHLPEGPIREVSADCALFAFEMTAQLPDGPELTVGLRKLLEAKDAFVRCAVAAQRAVTP